MSLRISRDPVTGKPLYKVQLPGQENQVYVFEGDEDSASHTAEDMANAATERDDMDSLFDDVVRPKRAREPALPIQASTSRPRRGPETTKVVETLEVDQATLVQDVEQTLRVATWRALQTVYAFVGKIEAALGGSDVRRHYRWIGKNASLREQQTPVVSGARTLSELYERNAHLGPRVIAAAVASVATIATGEGPETEPFVDPEPEEFMQQTEEGDMVIVKPAKIQNMLQHVQRHVQQQRGRVRCELQRNVGRSMASFQTIGVRNVALLPNNQEEIEVLRALVGDEQVLMHPEWVLCALGDATLQFMLRQTTYGAIEMSANELRRLPNLGHVGDELVRALILSQGVSDMFAEFVANKFLAASGGNAYPARINGTGRTSYFVSAGFRTRTERSRWSLGAKYWFQRVFYVQNPAARAVSQQQIDALERERQRYVEMRLLNTTRLEELIDGVEQVLANFGIRALRNRYTQIPVLPEGFRELIEYSADPEERANARAAAQMHDEAVVVHQRVVEAQAALAVKDAQLAKMRRQHECVPTHMLVYQALGARRY